MKFIDYAGETIALILTPPNWREAKPRCETLLPFTTIDKALSARESRRNWGRSSRYTIEFAPRFRTAAAATEFRLGLNALKVEPVAVPMWLDGVKISALSNAGATTLPKAADMPVRFGAEWIILGTSGAFEIVVVTAITSSTVTLSAPTALTWPAGSMMFPLLFGRFAERPKLESITPSTVQGGLKIVEDSPYARRLNPAPGSIPVVGASVPNFSTLPLWTIAPNWSGVVDTTEADVLIKQLGFTRTTARQAYPQPNRRIVEREFVCNSRAAIAAVERFLVDRRGPVRPFMIPTFDNDLELAVNLPISGNANHITIKANEYSSATRTAQSGDPYIALIEGAVISPQKITNVAAGDLTTAVAIAQSFTPAKARISHLLLARFAEPKITWTYSRPDRATCRLKFVELPDEYANPQADKPERAFALRFSEFVDVAVNRGLFTSYEQALDYLGADWQPAPFDLGTLNADLKFGDKLELTTFDFPAIPGVIAANPLKLLLAQSAEGKLWLDVDEVNPLDPDDGSAVFVIGGEIVSPDFSGKEWKAVVDPFGGVLDRETPGFNFQKVCAVPLFHPKCAFGRPTMRADFKSVGTLSTVVGKVIELAPIVGQPDLTAKPENYFAGGKIEVGTGLTFESRSINSSSTVSGKLRLVLGRELIKATGTPIVSAWPGCNGDVNTCIGTFNNLANFRAHPYPPVKNPGANVGDVQQSTGGKKG